jgi:hypothetical protein
MEGQEAADPIDVSLLGADGIMFAADERAETVEEI